MRRDLTIRIAGESGEGIVTAGDVLATATARIGLNVNTYRTYPAEMRGGPSIYQIRLDRDPVLSHGHTVDLLIAFNADAYRSNRREVSASGVLIYDSDAFKPDDDGLVHYGLPFTTIATKQLGNQQGKNIVTLGALASLLRFPVGALKTAINDKLGRKTEQLAQRNLTAFQAGFEYAQANLEKRDHFTIEPGDASDRLLLSGNQAIALGAIAAGCRFFAGYPITPATDIMEFMAAQLPKFGGDLVQTEDEIAALSAAIGAAFAGVKSMTATSGPGLSLMSELINLASTAEIPVVIVDSQRAGPSTGMPTKMEQSDLNQMIYGGHGEGPRIVLAPTSVEDAFYKMITAFNLAERYQMPVIVAVDQALSVRTQTIPRPHTDEIQVVSRVVPDLRSGAEYKRYALTATGVSPRTIPGEANGMYVATGLEHDEFGHPSYDPKTHEAMVAKRYQKLAEVEKEFHEAHRFGATEPEVGIIGWGSTEGAVREAVAEAQASGIYAAGLYPVSLNPLPDDEILTFVKPLRHVIVAEANYTGQLAGLLRSKYGIETDRLNRFDGLPLTADEVLRKILEVADNGRSNQ